ncbi:MAG: adenylate/guanylate cyclase domain-containing protein [Hyphomicrobiaceae bacterium]
MTDQPEISRIGSLGDHYIEALVASGLVDDLSDILALAPRPYRYAEGEFICRHGDPVECLWVIVNGSVAIKEGDTTFFVRRRNELVGEQHIVGNGYRRIYDLIASESSVEVLAIDKKTIEAHPEAAILWRNISRIISMKLRNASRKAASLSRQLADDTRILHAYTNEYALSRRLQSGSGRQAEYKVERAIVWFSDVVDFSRHTLSLAPDRTADIVQRFFNAQSLPIVSNGGHIDKFIGDGLMAFWVLAEKSDGRDKEFTDVIRAAEEAVAAVGEIAIGTSALRLRVGLHVGFVLSGDFGSATRHQFTLIGTEVNKAARLEQVHTEDIVEGSKALGDIRLSTELRSELSDINQRRYQQKFIAKAKNIGALELYSA